MAETLAAYIGNVALPDFLKQLVQSVSLVKDKHGRCESLTLWPASGDGLRMISQMHDVAERREVGVLSFSFINRPDTGAVIVDFDPALEITFAYKLVMHDSGFELESGLKLKFGDARELLILPADFPFFLSVSGSAMPEETSTPEYSIEAYQAVQIFGAKPQQGN